MVRPLVLVALGLITAAELLVGQGAATTDCWPDEFIDTGPQMRIMTAQSDACSHLGVRASSAWMAALVIGVSAFALVVAPRLPARWRKAPIGLVVVASAFPVFIFVLFRQWDPRCGPIDSYLGSCAHPPWILGPALLVASGACLWMLRAARRGT